jgi:hypothetical protein
LTAKNSANQFVWDCIIFDAVESGQQQDVAISRHRTDGRNYMEITLITPPIPAAGILGSLDPLDN